MFRRLSSLVRLAAKDYFSEWKMSGFSILALAAVLGPMMILFGLKYGMVGSMVDKLLLNPHNLEIRSLGSGRFDENFLDQLRKRENVSFVAPEQRSIASSVELQSTNASDILSVQLSPTAKGDPLLVGVAETPGMDEIILSAPAAKRLKVKAGDSVSGSIARTLYNQPQREHFTLKVLAVAPLQASDRDIGFVHSQTSQDVSAYRDGHRAEGRGWNTGSILQNPKPYPAFRAYARNLDDLEDLQSFFELIDLDVRTRSQEAALVRGMDQNLTSIYWVVAIIGLVGYALSLAATLWSNVDRKRRDLSVLRVVGYRTGDIVWFPVVQALFTGILGWLMATAIYFGVGELINSLLAEQLEAGQKVCVLLPQHYVIAMGITAITAIIAAGLAGFRASRIEPADGLREI